MSCINLDRLIICVIIITDTVPTQKEITNDRSIIFIESKTVGGYEWK